MDNSHTEGSNSVNAVHENVVISNQTHIVFLGRTDLTWKFIDVSPSASFVHKWYIHYIDAPKDANSLLFHFSPFIFDGKVRRQFSHNDLDSLPAGAPSKGDWNNNIGPRIFTTWLQTGGHVEFEVFQESVQNNWVDITKPIYEFDGVLARKGWYSSHYSYSMPSGKTRDYGYWDGKEWYNTHSI